MSTFQTSDGLTLYYEDDGDGLPILCLAGLTRNCRDFDFVAPHLQGVRLIRMDYRGRGRSDYGKWQDYTLPVECRDVVELIQHLGLAQTAILGTSRGGLNAMGLAANLPDLLLGVALNDIGPEIDLDGIGFIMTYLGRNPASKTHEDVAAATAHVMTSFENVPLSRWIEMSKRLYRQSETGLEIKYDTGLRAAVEAQGHQETPDLWPLFDALPPRALALIWGVNSDLLKAQTVAEMERRRPDMITARVPGRGHVPFLDEPEALDALHRWIEAMR